MFFQQDVNFQEFIHIQYLEQDLFRYLGIVSIISENSEGEKNSLDLDVYVKNDGSKKDLFNGCSITDGYFSWIVCSCKFSISESFFSSEVNRILITDKSGQWFIILRYPFFDRIIIISDIVSFKIADCCSLVLLFFLIGFS